MPNEENRGITVDRKTGDLLMEKALKLGCKSIPEYLRRIAYEPALSSEERPGRDSVAGRSFMESFTSTLKSCGPSMMPNAVINA